MPCSKEAVARLFLNLTSSCKLLFLFFYFSSLLLSKLFTSLFNRSQNDDDNGMLYYYDEEEEEEEEEAVAEEEEEEELRYCEVENAERDDLVADVRDGEEALVFWPSNCPRSCCDRQAFAHDHGNSSDVQMFSVKSSPDSYFEDSLIEVEDIPSRDSDSEHIVLPSEIIDGMPDSPTTVGSWANHQACQGRDGEEGIEGAKGERNFSRDDKFLIFRPPKSESKKLSAIEKEDDHEVLGNSCTVGSTSKSSSEWRSSTTCRDSATDDPFSSSSRRSCPKWESYTVFQKYDEEMVVLDRISAQKLHETESLRSFKVQPRSISERIVHKLGTKSKRSQSNMYKNNPYYELEAAYVAQICLTWEALSWNYVNFQRKRAARLQRGVDQGCPAQIAQQFQQFQVLLQRYIENEPFEYGRRPEVYARIRRIAPKLLQVPEYQDDEDEEKDEVLGSRITSAAFVAIMEDAIRTFMNFLKADRGGHCQILTALFWRRQRGSVDPALLHMMKKANKRKKSKLKEMHRGSTCFRRRKLSREEDMEILMGLIDLKVASRVLRMTDITQEQLQWSEEKMVRVRVCEGKLHRDSSPLFFPAQSLLL
ncbi:hypothetical protein Nepgr_005789 [Nepenthes gracilis]|uniref:Uncharacterized protein n=1 Tax=Nepenthes gracilis TaxID=150966 RepID=A0AAD3S460_NEPGR|nr:hypothetical protein Nepgr_005789 [Nepenthes gracilis]